MSAEEWPEILVCPGCGRPLRDGVNLKLGKMAWIDVVDGARGSCDGCAPAEPSSDADDRAKPGSGK